MSLTYSKADLSEGVTLTTITDKRFKTNYVSINFITKLDRNTAALNALIPTILSKNSNKYKTITELNKKLTSLYGANLSGDVSKLGDNQVISMSANCIADKYTLNKEKIFNDLLEVLLDCIFNPYADGGAFNEKSFLLCKQELIDDIEADINDKRSYAIIRSGKTICKGEPSEITSHGDKESADKITSKDAYNQYLEIIKSSEIQIFLSGGDITDKAKEKLSTEFGSIKRKYKKTVASEFSPIKATAIECKDNMDVVQSKMVMAFKSQSKNVPAIKVMNAIFGVTPFSKLFLNVREKYSLCYYCAAGYNDSKGVLIVDSGVQKTNITKAKEEILNQFNEMVKGNFNQEEIDNSVLSIINSLRGVSDSPYTLASWYLKQNISGTDYTPEQEIDRVLSVKKEEIVEVAKSFKLDTVYVLTSKGE